MFKAHSTQAASSMKAAMVGMTLEEIIQAADWSCKGVSQKFYHQPKHSLAYGSKVVATGGSRSGVDMETEPSEIELLNGSGHAMATYDLELYEEGVVGYQQVPTPLPWGKLQPVCYH